MPSKTEGVPMISGKGYILTMRSLSGKLEAAGEQGDEWFCADERGMYVIYNLPCLRSLRLFIVGKLSCN